MTKVNPFQELNRKIFFNDPHKNHHFHYPINQIKSCKYTLITFLPKALYIQFLRVANIYFLAIAIISSMNEVSSVGPVTSIVPLVFVLGTSIIREALEDWARYKNDKIINNQTTLAYKSTALPKNCKQPVKFETPTPPGGFEFQEVRWRDLHVGDLVKIRNDEQIPADIILLSSSDENGLAYVETANLDGEKNLKLKQARLEIKARIDEVCLEGLTGAMLIDSPNPKIQQFKGVMEIDELSTIYLGYSNLILRGTHLRNTEYVIGVVAYTGHDTKLMRNQGGFRNKKSHIEKQLNKYIIGVFISQCLLCLILTLFATFWNEKYEQYFETGKGPRLSYIFPQSYQTTSQLQTQKQNGPFIEGLITYASFMILLNTMIPISLIVSLEFAKFYQSRWIEYDELIKDGDQKCKVLNMLIHEDLAKIDYVFADKTGTLTTNEMKFMNSSIYGSVYSREKLLRMAHTPKSQSKQTQSDRYYYLFWLSISLCHDVIIDKKHEHEKGVKPSHPSYQGSSPDEVELVGAAAQVNFVFNEKKGDIFTVLVNGESKKFMLLTKIDFSSDRKRMSVVMRDLESNQLYVFCKGADSMIVRRLSAENSLEVIDKTKDDLQTFSKEGLRTLAIAYKVLDQDYFMDWQRRYAQAQQEEFNVLAEVDPQIKIRELEEELEKDLLLLGATALEDRLQDGVGETINDLHKAGIKVWMLTGDKLETAENIGYATNLLASETKVFKVGTTDPTDTLKLFKKIDERIKMIKEQGHAPFSMGEEVDTISPGTATNKFASFALIIDGEAINSSFHNDQLKDIFVRLIPEFRTVICCRSTPNQKADVVKFVKNNLKKMTLAIGDGGNDVNMIQSADIGVGIFGKEGNQAAFASDYAISKFFFLWRLLFVHGRWSYLRSANFITFFFYKNIIFTFPQFWFAIYSGYSGQSIYEDLYLSNYNTIFTSVAPVYYAAQEQDVNVRENETIFKCMPKLYSDFREANLFSPKKFLFWWATGVLHSIAVFYLTQESLTGTVDSHGNTFELWRQSITALSGVFLTVFSVIIIGTNFYQAITFVCYVIFTLMMFFPAGTIVMDQLDSPAQHILGDILGTPKSWLTLLLITVVCSMSVYIPKMYFSFFQPTLVDLLQRDRNKRWKKRDIEIYESKPKELTPDANKFDFVASIMMDGWYKTGDTVK